MAATVRCQPVPLGKHEFTKAKIPETSPIHLREFRRLSGTSLWDLQLMDKHLQRWSKDVTQDIRMPTHPGFCSSTVGVSHHINNVLTFLQYYP